MSEGNSFKMPPNILSAETAVSVSNGVGAGLTNPESLPLYLALTIVSSWSVTSIK